MSFADPALLLGLLAVPLALGAHLLAQRRRRRYLVRFTATPTVAALVAAERRWRRHLPLALWLAALALLVVALARPELTLTVPVERASIMLVTDTSGSMTATDVAPSRIEAARRAARAFLDRVPPRLQVGAVAFADSPYRVQQPSRDHAEVRSLIDSVSADGGTATGEALAAALDALRTVRGRDGARAPSAVILLSDGQTTTGRDPVEVAREAGRLRIPIFTVTLGTPTGSISSPSSGYSISVRPDAKTLRTIARVSGGQALKAEQGDELGKVYERLGSRLGTRRERREVTAGFAAAGAVLLAGALLLAARRAAPLP